MMLIEYLATQRKGRSSVWISAVIKVTTCYDLLYSEKQKEKAGAKERGKNGV